MDWPPTNGSWNPLEWDPVMLLVMGAVSVLGMALVVAATHLVVRQMPIDYFRNRNAEIGHAGGSKAGRTAKEIGRNVAGVLLFIAGIVMMLTPGPGVLALLLGLILVDFPGRRRLLTRIAKGRKMREKLNGMRRRVHREPFDFPEELAADRAGADDESGPTADRRAS